MGDISSLPDAKAALRRAMLARRAEMDPGLGHALAARVLAEAPPPAGAVVAGFWPMAQEIDIRPLLLALHERGHPIALPVTPPRGQPLRFHAWTPGDTLAAGPMGTRQPAGGPERTPGWLLVPLLAFDRRGGRLGHGAGYYDRTLPGLPGAFAMGVAFACQEVPEVPTDAHDARLDAIATEAGVIRVAGA